jgi:hypothetical protein
MMITTTIVLRWWLTLEPTVAESHSVEPSVLAW